MAFWDIFNKKNRPERESAPHGGLHQKVVHLLPDAPEDTHIQATCVAGLMARVAWCDLDIHQQEIGHMNTALQKWLHSSPEEAQAIVSLALEHIRELAGLDNHKYTGPINRLSDESRRFNLLKVLFALAASDGSVAQKEVEEIRLISRGLLLEHRHFVAAKATVLESLASLQN